MIAYSGDRNTTCIRKCWLACKPSTYLPMQVYQIWQKAGSKSLSVLLPCMWKRAQWSQRYRHIVYCKKNRRYCINISSLYVTRVLKSDYNFTSFACEKSVSCTSGFLHTQVKISCNKSANKPSTSCVRTACHKLSTSLEQAVNNFVDIIVLVARLFRQVWYSHDIVMI
jgi:hypothetical protein